MVTEIIGIHKLALNENNVGKITRLFTIKTGDNYCELSSFLNTALDTRLIDEQPAYFLARQNSKSVEIWNLTTKRNIQTIQSGYVENVFFHPDHRSIFTYSGNTGLLSLWDIENGLEKNKIDLDNNRWHGNHLDVSKDGSRIGIFSTPYNTISDSPISEFNLLNGHKTDSYYAFPLFEFTEPPFIYSPKGSLVVVFYDQNENFRFVNITDQIETTLQNPITQTKDSSFERWLLSTISMDSSEKYIVGGTIGGDLYIWGTSDGSLIKTIKAHEQKITDGWFGGIRYLSFSPSSNLLVSVGYDKSTKLWNAKNGELLRAINSCHNFGGFTQDGRYLVFYGKNGIEVWGIPN